MVEETKIIESNKEEILSLLKLIEREGKEELIKWLKNSDFFEAPASTKFHLSCKGGLAQHSLNVYKLLLEKNHKYKLGWSKDTVVICGLLHDICKVNFYKKTHNSYKKYKVKDAFPLGHGEKSVFLVNKFIPLTNAEALAIRWHMNAFDDAVNGFNNYSFNNAKRESPLIELIFICDYEATIIEGIKK